MTSDIKRHDYGTAASAALGGVFWVMSDLLLQIRQGGWSFWNAAVAACLVSVIVVLFRSLSGSWSQAARATVGVVAMMAATAWWMKRNDTWFGVAVVLAVALTIGLAVPAIRKRRASGAGGA